ncbi:unnamed protein product, partial [Didymodactylos carnosus]
GVVNGRIDVVLDTLIEKQMDSITFFAEHYFMNKLNQQVQIKSKFVVDSWASRANRNRSLYQQQANDSVLRRLNKTQTVDIKYNEDLHIQQWELHPRNNYSHAIILCLSGISVWRKKLLRSNNSFNKIMTKDRITKNDIDVIKNYLDVEKLLQNNENESKKIICLLRHI